MQGGNRMELIKSAIAGTMESSDVRIILEPNHGGGIEIHLESVAKATFGDAIEATVRQVLAEFDVKDACITLNDRGALDCTIRARMQCAVCRAAETKYDWGKVDFHV